MLIKEYRIALPMSVEEYRIAQLYMIQKKSREESRGAGSGVEILINEPYQDGPGGAGQYTHKIYHIGSHLPGWFRSILPKSALQVEEKAWNAYPYTRTVYTCPFIEKFSLDIETRYLSDGGTEDNVFDLPEAERRNRVVDTLDIVKDPIAGSEYTKEEDPRIFVSDRTGRGPLNDNWLQEYIDVTSRPNCTDKAIMCAYKLCKVEFKYWGMQSKIERFIHDIGLRKTMLRAHRQAWCWQDEYYGLTIEDIRALELETQLALQETMGRFDSEDDSETKTANKKETINLPPQESTTSANPSVSSATLETNSYHSSPKGGDEQGGRNGSRTSMSTLGASRKQSWGSARSHKPAAGGSDRNLSEWRVESLEKLQTSSSEDEEFFDAQDDVFDHVGSVTDPSLFKSSSMEMLNQDDDYQDTSSPGDWESVVEYYGPPPLYSSVMSCIEECDETDGVSPLDRRVEQYRQLQAMGGSHSLDLSAPATPTPPTPSAMAPSVCRTTILFMALHGGSIMDTGHEAHGTKQSDLGTLKTTFETVIRAHYPAILGHVAVKLIPCPAICSETLSLLASLNPYSFDAQSPVSSDSPIPTSETLPVGAVSLFATGSAEYYDAVATVIVKGNAAYNDFLRSEEGIGFNGQVCLIGDSVGSILGYDALCKQNPYLISRSNSRYGSHGSLTENDHVENETERPVSRKTNLETIKQVSVSNPDLTTIGVDEDTAKTKLSEQEGHETSGSRKSHTHPHVRHASCPNSRRTSTGSTGDMGKFEFEVTDFFMFGSPLGLVLAYRRMCLAEDKTMYGHMQYLDPLAAVIGYNFKQQKDDALPRPACTQIYNLFYPSDPSAVRIEPLIYDRFKSVPPCKVARYQKFPLGDGQSLHVVETIQSNIELFSGDHLSPSPATHGHDHPTLERRQSNMSITSQISGHADYLMSNLASVTSRWWGNKRLDFALYCPDALHSFPTAALPYLLHASFWESADVVAFILRQVVRQEYMMMPSDGTRDEALFKPTQPREKWLKRRTTIKLRNVAPNHRANDVIVLEDRPQVLPARFMYGPLDMVSLSGERVDVHVVTKPPSGEWVFIGTKDTDSNGRVVFTIPEDKKLPQGMYPVKMVVRGDHTSVDFFLTVLPPKTECVIFSIDGSFTASVSIMAKDPKVRAGAVDVVRHWQEMGYLIIYITARPDMQQKKVVAWLAQHNFPHGMVAFMEGLSADPLRQKANYLRTLVNEAEIQVHVAYGSSKDITVYQNIGLTTQQIFIVGKVSKKHYKEAQVISDGYAAHLASLSSHGMSRPAVGNARMFIRRSCFSLPGQTKPGSKKTVRKTVSLPQRGSMKESSKKELTIGISESGNTVIDPALGVSTSTRVRGMSPRVKMSPYRYDSTNA